MKKENCCEQMTCDCLPFSHSQSEDWKEKIRRDYHGVLSKEQIENTIGYWEQYWEEMIQAEREKAYEKWKQYNYDLGRGKGHEEERDRLKKEINKLLEP